MHHLVSATTPYQISKKFGTGVLYRKLLITTVFPKNLHTKKDVLRMDINEVLPVFVTFIIPFDNIINRKCPQIFAEEM